MKAKIRLFLFGCLFDSCPVKQCYLWTSENIIQRKILKLQFLIFKINEVSKVYKESTQERKKRIVSLSLSLSLFLSLYISVSYSGFTAVASLKYMIDPEHLPIPVSCNGTSL